MVRRFLTVAFLSVVSVSSPVLGYSDLAFIDKCFNLREAHLLSNYQHCDDLPGRSHYGEKKEFPEGRIECISKHWSSKDGKPVSKNFGWVTLKNGKRQGPAELAVDHYYLGASDDKDETPLKLNFKDDQLDGTLVVPSPKTGEKCELIFEAGKVKGLVKVTSKSGKLLGAKIVNEGEDSWKARYTIVFCKSGKLSEFHCDTRSHLEEDKSICGFGAAEPVKTVVSDCGDDKDADKEVFWMKDGKVHKTRQTLYQWPFRELDDDPNLKGQVALEVTADPAVTMGDRMESATHQYFYPNGKPLIRFQTKKEMPVNELSYLSEEGKKLAEAKFRGDQGEMIFYAEYFLNGEPRVMMKDIGDKKTRIVRKDSYDESRVQDCVYVDAPVSQCGYYDNPKCHSRENLRINLDKYGLTRGGYSMVPITCKIIDGGEETATLTYKDGYLDGPQTQIDRQEGVKQVSDYKEGTLLHVKTIRLSDKRTIEEYKVLKDGSKEYLKRASGESAPRRGT